MNIIQGYSSAYKHKSVLIIENVPCPPVWRPEKERELKVMTLQRLLNNFCHDDMRNLAIHVIQFEFT